jgi:hypothetical protein
MREGVHGEARLEAVCCAHAGGAVDGHGITRGAKTPGPNGQIAFSRYDQATGEPRMFIANSDGTHEHQLLLPLPRDGPVWSPDGDKLLVTVFRSEASVRSATVNADGSGFAVLDIPQLPQDMDMGCRAWSPAATRLRCQAIRFEGDPSLNGHLHHPRRQRQRPPAAHRQPIPATRRFRARVTSPATSRPTAPGSSSCGLSPAPARSPDRNQTGALFVENTNGTGLRQLIPYGLANSHDNGLAHWSRDGRKILC